MEMTKMIGGLVGPTLVALGVAILINSGNVSALAEGVSRDPALILMSGMLSFIAGLAIVRAHNRWTWSWPVIVTVVGWLLIVGGLVRFLFPMWLARVAQGMTPNSGVIVAEAIIFLLAGGFLSFKAYGRE